LLLLVVSLATNASAQAVYVGRTETFANPGPVTINAPSGLIQGDLMLLYINSSAAACASFPPSGWTQFSTSPTNNAVPSCATAAYRVFQAGDSSWSGCTSSSTFIDAIVRGYHNVATVNQIDSNQIDPATAGTNTSGATYALAALANTAVASETYVGFWSGSSCGPITGPADLNGTAGGSGQFTWDGDKTLGGAGSTAGAETASESAGCQWTGFAVTIEPFATTLTSAVYPPLGLSNVGTRKLSIDLGLQP
jgi:hypothetical protein